MHKPDLTLKDANDETTGNGGDSGTVDEAKVVDDTCRVAAVHCDHIKGTSIPVLAMIVFFVIGHSVSFADLPRNSRWVKCSRCRLTTFSQPGIATNFYGEARRNGHDGTAVSRSGRGR